jgi:hypothetical protein
MKKPQAILAGVVFTLGLIFNLHAQDTATSVAALSDTEVLLQAVEQTPPLPADSATNGNAYYATQHAPGSSEPWPPFPGDIAGLPAWDLGGGTYLLDDRNYVWGHHRKKTNFATTTTTLGGMQGLSRMSSMGIPSFPTNDDEDDGDTNSDGYTPAFSGGTPIDTNGLWLQITNYDGSFAYLNLNNATDQVYAVWTTTNLLTGWQTEAELWPTTTQTNVLPFTVPTLGEPIQFVRAQDWTGVTAGGNETPLWWFWEYFGTTNLSDTNLDSEGNTLLYDYQNGFDPNIISFTPSVTNNYESGTFAPVQLNITGGTPSYYAVSVDDTNYQSDASWQSYAGNNLSVYLGVTQGWHDVWIGLKGLPSNATQTWQHKRLKLDFTPPPLVLTGPTNSTVAQPVIQLTGYSPEALSSISYDLTNALGWVTNQQVLITDQFYSTNTFEFTTNWFQCFDVGITNGVNTFTLHAIDLAGNVTTTNFSFTLDYSSKTNPPTIQNIWPQDGMKVCGSNFVWNGWVSDPTATVVAQMVDTNGTTNVFNAAVGRDGKFWIQNVPLNSGTNHYTLTVTDVAGNIATTNIAVIQGDAGLTVNPITPNQTTVTGGINSTNFTIWVNGVRATITGNTWEADDVPIPPNSSLVQVTAIPNGGGQ